MEDKQFVNQFLTVLGILVGITILILIIARVLSGTHNEPDQAMQEAIAARIEPIGKVNVGTVPVPPAVQQAEVQTTDASMSPADVYQTACVVCHATGVANAPVYGDKPAWATRLGDLQTLYANALNGKGAMPAKGGRPDLSDETIKAVVDYMLEAVR